MISKFDDTYYQAIKNYDTIMVFGASINGKVEKRWCEKYGKKIKLFLVSNKYEEDEFEGVKVCRLSNVDNEYRENGLVIVGRAWDNYEESCKLLKQYGFKNIIFGINQNRIGNLETDIKKIKELFGNDSVCGIPNNDNTNTANCNVKIYAVTSCTNFHSTERQWMSQYISYIQAGAALTSERICSLTDDIGDNISKYNYYLNETTAGYWIANNDTEHDYVGLYHYGRGMDLNDSQIEWIHNNNVDIVLKYPNIYRYNMLSFSGDKTHRAICKFFPDYADASEIHMRGNMFFQGNIQISKREIFKEYYEWSIGVIEKMGGMYKDEIEREHRFLAFAMETVLNVWCIKNADRFRFAFAPIKDLFISK